IRHAMSLADQTPLEQQRCWRMHEVCVQVQRWIEEGSSKKAAYIKAESVFCGEVLICPQTDIELKLDFSADSLRRHYKEWQTNPTAESFIRNYKGGKKRIPDELIKELQRRGSREGAEEFSVVIRSIHNDWRAGREVPGLGTWMDWWAANHPEYPLPAQAPDFPFSERGLRRYQPDKATKEWGARGKAAAMKHLPHMVRDSSTLKPGQLYVSDDVRLDFIVADEMSGRPIEVRGYIMMDWGTRYIPSFVLRPANAVLQTDVDAMLARGLQTLGLRPEEHTFIMFERGTVACSTEAEKMLERASGGRIKVVRTGMNGGTRYPGAAPDQGSGHWMGKGIIESFMAQLHRLMREHGAPGQRGNRYDRQPANLGFKGTDRGIVKGSLADEAQKLAKLQLHFKSRVQLNLPLLTFSQANALVRKAIDAHNHNRNHGFQGFSKVTVRETAPGVWADIA
ncbi:MAG: hypothetical protein AAGF10_05330, partial [Verrucomicrobiota bacterium]